MIITYTVGLLVIEPCGQVAADFEVAKAALSAVTSAEQAARRECDALREALVDQKLRAATSEARVNEIERRANDLSAELARQNQQDTSLVAGLAAAAAKSVAPTGAVSGQTK